MSFGAVNPRANILDPSEHPLALVAGLIFAFAYALVIAEEVIHMRKSKAVTLAAGSIWVLIGIVAFFLSPIADNLTTALVMGAVILAIGAEVVPLAESSQTLSASVELVRTACTAPPPHCQPVISGMSSPYSLMYCLCSMSLSRMACFA